MIIVLPRTTIRPTVSKMLGAQSVQVVSNLKDVSPPLPFDVQAHEKLRQDLTDRVVWLAASTHPGEEDAVAHVHERLRGDLPTLLTIIVPRHPERGDQIGRDLTMRGLTCARRSTGAAISGNTDIYIADNAGRVGLTLPHHQRRLYRRLTRPPRWAESRGSRPGWIAQLSADRTCITLLDYLNVSSPAPP